MAISKEDKKDVATHMGKALANKVSKVTKDKSWGERRTAFNKSQSNKKKDDMYNFGYSHLPESIHHKVNKDRSPEAMARYKASHEKAGTMHNYERIFGKS